MSVEKLIKELIINFSKFSENEDINFVDCIAPNENAHTRILIDLLKSNDEYLNSFIDYINSNYNFYLPQINTNEKDFIIEHNKKNIDGLVKDSNTAIIIENKVKWATDQNRQLERYVGKIFCDNYNFLIDVEDRITKEILEEIKKYCNTELQKQLDSLINKKEKELICIIDELKNNKNEIYDEEVKGLLNEKTKEYNKLLIKELEKKIGELIEKSKNKKQEEKLIKKEREQIYVLYLVPNDMKNPSIYSYTTATKIFLNDDIPSNGRFIKITYKQIIDWMSNLNTKGKPNLYNSIYLYSNHIDNYIRQDEKKYKIIKEFFKDDYNQMQNCLRVLEANKSAEIEDKNFRTRTKIINSINSYISKKLDDIFCLIKDIVIEKEYEKIKADKQHFFRFIPKGINIPKAKKSFNDWDRILGFEFKIHDEKLILSFCVISENKWDEKDIFQNKNLIYNVIENLKGSSEYESIKTYVEKYNETKWIIEECFRLPISELIGKKDNEIKKIIEKEFFNNQKFSNFVNCLK